LVHPEHRCREHRQNTEVGKLDEFGLRFIDSGRLRRAVCVFGHVAGKACRTVYTARSSLAARRLVLFFGNHVLLARWAVRRWGTPGTGKALCRVASTN
jgi:hypothetical protein